MAIHKRGSKWIVTTEDGRRIIGTHDTKKEAEDQLAAIEIAKHKRRR